MLLNFPPWNKAVNVNKTETLGQVKTQRVRLRPSSETPLRPPPAAADPAMDSKVILCGLCCVQLRGGDQEVRRHMETVHSCGLSK